MRKSSIQVLNGRMDRGWVPSTPPSRIQYTYMPSNKHARRSATVYLSQVSCQHVPKNSLLMALSRGLFIYGACGAWQHWM